MDITIQELTMNYPLLITCPWQIKIDGQDIQEVTQESLRKSIGVVPQDTV